MARALPVERDTTKPLVAASMYSELCGGALYLEIPDHFNPELKSSLASAFATFWIILSSNPKPLLLCCPNATAIKIISDVILLSICQIIKKENHKKLLEKCNYISQEGNLGL